MSEGQLPFGAKPAAEVMRQDAKAQAKISHSLLQLHGRHLLQPGVHIGFWIFRDERVPAPHAVLVGAAFKKLCPHAAQAGQDADALGDNGPIAHTAELHHEVEGLAHQLQLVIQPLLRWRQKHLAFARLQEPLPQLAELAPRKLGPRPTQEKQGAGSCGRLQVRGLYRAAA